MSTYGTTPVTITVHPEERQTFNSYGFYLSHGGDTYRKMKKETKDKIAKFLFEDLKCRTLNSNVCIMPGWGNKQDRYSFDADDVEKLDEVIRIACVEELGIGDGSPIDYAPQYGCEWGITLCGIDGNWIEYVENREDYLNANADTIGAIAGGTNFDWMGIKSGEMLKYECIPNYIHRCAQLVKRMCLHWKLPIASVACYDEPNFGMIAPDQMCQIVIGMRKELDAAGLQHVKIRGPELAGINFAYAQEMMKNKEAWDAVDICSIHSFGTGYMDTEHAEQALATGKEVHINSTGIDLGICIRDLPVDENGVRYSDSYDAAVGNVSAFIVDINLRISYMGMWLGLFDVNSLDQPVFFRHFLLDPDEKFLGTDMITTKDFDYFKTAMKAIEPGAVMRYCESSDEGDMSERYHLINLLKNQMAACAGVNKDGSWGIVLLNKTDSELRRKQRARIKDEHKAYMMMLPSADLEVELDIKGLEGSGLKKFQVYKTGKNNTVCKDGGIVELIDGKGTVTVHPLEILALREIVQ